jgi:hypothetical protein
MSERVIGESGSSSLPTPASRDWRGDNGRAGTLPNLLHTPTTGDTAPNYDHRASPGYTREKPVPNLAAQIEDELLPTPSGMGGGQTNRGGTRIDEPLLGGIVRSLGDPTSPPSDDGNEP